jgi:hypothetical protein
MWLSLMKAITLSIGFPFHDSYELVTRDQPVVVAESDDLVRAVVSTWLSRLRERVREQDGHHVLVGCGVRLGLASTGIRVPETQRWRSCRQGCGSLALRSAQRRWCALCRKLLGPNWRDGLICDRPVVQRAGLRVHT